MLKFIQSFFRKTPRPPAGCTRIQGAELRVGMVVSLHDLPWFDHVSICQTGRIYLLTYHGNRGLGLRGQAGAVEITAYLETLDGRDFGTIRFYWDEDVWIYDD
jgi:hypothetical protein